jgi:hypothetical protein
MTKPRTQAERMQRIETLVEQGFQNIEKTQLEFTTNWHEVKQDLSDIKKQMQADKTEFRAALDLDVADLAKLKNRGAGILTGVSIAVGFLSVSLADSFKAAMAKIALVLGAGG